MFFKLSSAFLELKFLSLYLSHSLRIWIILWWTYNIKGKYISRIFFWPEIWIFDIVKAMHTLSDNIKPRQIWKCGLFPSWFLTFNSKNKFSILVIFLVDWMAELCPGWRPGSADQLLLPYRVHTTPVIKKIGRIKLNKLNRHASLILAQAFGSDFRFEETEPDPFQEIAFSRHPEQTNMNLKILSQQEDFILCISIVQPSLYSISIHLQPTNYENQSCYLLWDLLVCIREALPHPPQLSLMYPCLGPVSAVRPHWWDKCGVCANFPMLA